MVRRLGEVGVAKVRGCGKEVRGSGCGNGKGCGKGWGHWKTKECLYIKQVS